MDPSRRLLVALALSLVASPGWAQGTPAPAAGQSHAATAPTARAVRVDTPIRLDGRLDDDAWAAAQPITGFTQSAPAEGQPSSERTEVRIVYDAEALYVGAYLYDSAPVRTRLLRRDAQAEDSDWLELFFDSYHDHQTANSFAVNPSGVRRDRAGVASQSNSRRGSSDAGAEWNPVWDVATEMTDSGWVAEIRIPFSQLRFPRAAVQTWGMQIQRNIARRAEEAQFAFIPRNDRGGPARYGHLEGLEGLQATDPLEVVPYLSGKADMRRVPRNAAVDFDNPFQSGSDLAGGFGADLQYRLSNNFTLNAAVNPDFGQVEVDPAVINLTAFETRLQENRPFFVEGADIFRFGEVGGFGAAQLLYTRRVGRAPSLGAPADAAYINMPESAQILGAAKLTGRTAGGWSLGLLSAVTNREVAPYVDMQGVQREVRVEPLSGYLVSRGRRDFNAGRTSFGGLLTAVNRRLEGETQVARLRDAAYSGGVDFRHEWANRTWSATGHLSPSHIRGSQAVMIAAQNSSARYFGRPDADHLSIDSTATSLSGYAGNLSIGKRSGAVTGSLEVGATSPGYEINDLGFQTTADRITTSFRLGYRQTRPGPLLRTWSVFSWTDPDWNFGGERVSHGLGTFLNAQLLNYWTAGAFIRHSFGTLSDRLTRGGPMAWEPEGQSISVNIGSDPRRGFTVGGEMSLFQDESGATNRSVGVSLGLRPAGNWDVRFRPNLSRTAGATQYVQAVSDPLADRTFGRRYIFAELDQTTLSLETRLNVSLTPDLTFELFAQPLIASGDYGTLMELERPRTFRFVRYGADGGSTVAAPDARGRYTVDPDGAGPARPFQVSDRDFNTRSLRGNAVLRWEWRPGSTLFLVWQQSRAETLNALAAGPGFGRVGSFHPGRDARDLIGLRPDNIFMLKMTYWLNP